MDIDDPEDSGTAAPLPSAETCMDLCKTFVEFTETDKALAMMFLQENSWNLEIALASFYGNVESLQHGRRSPPTSAASSQRLKRKLPELVIDLVSDCEEENTAQEDVPALRLFRILSWNIDGLSAKSREFRTVAVVSSIKRERFHIVCLQEVVEDSLAYLKQELDQNYAIFHPPDLLARDYFPAICVLKQSGISADPNSFEMTRFPGSVMQRVLLGVDVSILMTPPAQPIRLRVWTSHLESCANFATERKHQMQQVWQIMREAVRLGRADFGIFCGDMNIRDTEIRQLGGLPSGIRDVWEACGCRPEAKATWDPQRNPNLTLDDAGDGGGFSLNPNRKAYGMRFDRMYVVGEGRFSPVDFQLRGLERVPRRSHFPSDHWAILGQFCLSANKDDRQLSKD